MLPNATLYAQDAAGALLTMPLGTLVEGKQTQSQQQLFCLKTGSEATPPQLLAYPFTPPASHLNRAKPPSICTPLCAAGEVFLHMPLGSIWKQVSG